MRVSNAIAAAALALSGTAGMAQDMGETEYMVACAGCHGESGMGDGPFAELLNVSTPGLTTLAADNDGAFPFTEVFLLVDGRGGVRAHGSDMPVWGQRFTASAMPGTHPETAELVARGRVLSLVRYLESIQQE